MQVETVRPDTLSYEVADKMNFSMVGLMPVVDEENRPLGVITDRDIALRIVAERRDPMATYAREIMSHPAHYIFEDAELEDAAQAMIRKGVRRLLVKNHRGGLEGVLSIDDLALFAPGDRTAAHVLERLAATTVDGARMGAAFDL